MLKRCPECSATTIPTASDCEACGRIFETPKVPSDLKVFMGALAMFAIVIVAVAFLRSFIG
jgi:Na+/H+ antiporter NhaA